MATIVENQSLTDTIIGSSETELVVDLVATLDLKEETVDSPVIIPNSEQEKPEIESVQVINKPEDSLDTKSKRKLDKIIDSILKKPSVPKGSQFATLEDKYYALAQKLIDAQEQTKKLQLSNKETEKVFSKVSNQRDQVQAEYGKVLLVKGKLESLCRELQRQNKLVKEESIQRIEDEEKKRKEISNKFQSAIDEINQQVASNSDKNNMLIQENVQLTTKLKNLIEQYEVREQHIDKVLKHKDLEVQLANAKLQQSELKLTESTERNKKEKALFDVQMIELTKKCEIHMEAEAQLKAQLAVYTQKYEEFQSTLTKSNQVFESFRTEMDKMTKKIKKLESETNQWRLKCESTDKSLQLVIKQKEEIEEKNKKSQAKADIMEQLSRSLQTERNNLKQEIKNLEERLLATTQTQEEVVAVVGEAPLVEQQPVNDEQPKVDDTPQSTEETNSIE